MSKIDDWTYTKTTYKDKDATLENFKSIKDKTVEICPQCGEGIKGEPMKCDKCGCCLRCE